jgi:hypothetical protein
LSKKINFVDEPFHTLVKNIKTYFNKMLEYKNLIENYGGHGHGGHGHGGHGHGHGGHGGYGRGYGAYGGGYYGYGPGGWGTYGFPVYPPYYEPIYYTKPEIVIEEKKTEVVQTPLQPLQHIQDSKLVVISALIVSILVIILVAVMLKN